MSARGAEGGTVWFAPELVANYRPRGSFAALARQYYDYGRWKRVVLRRHARSLRARQLAPLLLLFALAASAVLAAAGHRLLVLAALCPGAWAAALLGASAATGLRRRRPEAVLMPAALATIHLAWAAGLLGGRAPGRRRRRQGGDMTSKSPLLVTGGAGYVGSHAVLAFREAGYPVVVLDNLSTGLRTPLPPDTVFLEGDAGNLATVAGVIREYGVEAVLHLAGSSSVPGSIARPLDYYRNNTVASANLIQACVEAGVRRFLFASSAAVYGAPAAMPVSEDTTPVPAHPYGRSKLATERLLAGIPGRHRMHHGMRHAALRYFNVAGADPRGRAGQSSRDAAHIVKAACEAAVGTREGVTVFGTDYDTPDGTCVRDYIHVSDLAAIHVAILRGLEDGHPGGVFNCGSGRGISVRELVAAVRREAGTDFPVREGDRRPGDPPALVADPSRLRRDFAWSPRFDNLGVIIRTALAWERSLAGKRGAARGAGRRLA